MVAAAVEFQTKNGSKKALAELNRPDGTFVKGELYVFAYDLLGVIVAHPINPKLVGKNLYEVPDANGKLFRREIVEGAKKQGSGWVDYVYKVPGSTKTEAKTTYYKLGGDIIFCAGVYQ